MLGKFADCSAPPDSLTGLKGWAPEEGKGNGRGEEEGGNLSPISTMDLGG